MAQSCEDLLAEIEAAQLTLAGLSVDAGHLDPGDLVQNHITAAGSELEQALSLIKIELGKEES